MLAQKQPPLKECVIAHWSRGPAPKISGAEAQNRSRGRSVHIDRAPKAQENWYLQGDGAMHSSAIQSDINTAESNFNKLFERCVDVCITG